MTMRQIVTGIEVARQPRRVLTTSEAFRAPFLKELRPHDNERAIGLALEQEKRRFVRQNEALERGRRKTTMSRLKLLATKEKNERLMALRHQLQKQRWFEAAVAAPVASRRPQPRLRTVKVRRG